MSDAPKNPDRTDDRRRQVGTEDEDPDGRKVADVLYGGLTEREPTEQEDGTT
jgi:hypothetical protein